MTARYNAASWYWFVGNKADVVFSSAGPGYVASTDAGYQAFLAGGNRATSILCDGELADVLLKAGVAAAVIAAGATDLGNLPPADALAVVQAMGCAISSTGTPAINGTYAVSGASWAKMTKEAQYIQTFGAFSGGQTQLPWLLPNSAAVAFPTTALFMSVVRAIGDYETMCELAALQPAPQTWPAAPSPVA